MCVPPMKNLLIRISLLCFLVLISERAFCQGMTERRVYYLDATYSMISPSKLWDPVRKDLAKAINAIDDDNTEIYVVAFGGNNGVGLQEWHGYATEEGKQQIIAGFMGYAPKKNTMTYLDIPLNDFYRTKVIDNTVTYCFLMTDGNDENKDPNKFANCLREWGGKYTNSNVYGFYVMLNQAAHDPKIKPIIDAQDHLWQVATADVNINLVRLDKNATLNIRSESRIEIPLKGKANHLDFTASFDPTSAVQVEGMSLVDGKLVVETSVTGDKATMPESFWEDLNVGVVNGSEFDILVTDKVKVNVLNKYERVITSPTSNQNMGKVTHYPKFFFVSGKVTPVTHKMEFCFNADASASRTYADFSFVDNKGCMVSPDKMIVKVNGETLEKNVFRVTPENPVVDFTIEFTPEADKGKYQGFLRLENHNVHRLNNDTYTGQVLDACKWTVYNRPVMNPLASALMWLAILILSAIILWMVALKPIFYPRFGSILKTFNVPGMAPIIVKFKGARMVVVSATPQKQQSGWNRIWTGKIIYKLHPAFITPMTFVPGRGKKILVRTQSGAYQISPNPMPGIGAAVITDVRKNLKINVN